MTTTLAKIGYGVKYVLFLVVLSLFCAGLGGTAVIVWEIFYGDMTNLKKSTILAKINEETKIFTLDEKTQIGSFFSSSHRSYVPIDEIPTHVIRAMVASEDKNFYQHYGVDPIAILKATGDCVRRKFRYCRGGSSITQQTVKNIVEKSDRTLNRKIKEMVRAFQLEKIYSKKQILEFYLNQFHVTSNGRGVGIAAQYYFNKDARDLDLVEGAFIAGSVKAPSKYNPFTKNTRERKEKAWMEADRRKNYVLRRMFEQGWISNEELKEAWKRRVPFNRGKFRTSEVALTSLIKRQLQRKEILEALKMNSIRELEHAGLKIYTTIDPVLQKKAQASMRHNLSRLETTLTEFTTEDPKYYKNRRSLDVGGYYFGKITEVKDDGKKTEITLSFGLPTGVITQDSLDATAKLLNAGDRKGLPFHLRRIAKRIKIGDVLFVEVLDYDEKSHRAVLALRRKPEINGGLIALDKGEVRAVVAGFKASGFNRAMSAVRQPGSVFKSVVYLAALQLGWNIVDKIDNQRRVFPFQGKFYYPRPDHMSPYSEVSMVWAGTQSENLASIYLTSHLLEKLSFKEFKQLLKNLDLGPQRGESAREYHFRLAKKTGVQLDNLGIREYLLEQSIKELEPDLIFSGNLDTLNTLKRIWWGNGYIAEMQAIQEFEDEKKMPIRERKERIALLKNNYRRIKSLARQFSLDWDAIEMIVAESGPEAVFLDDKYRTILSRFRVITERGKKPSLSYDFLSDAEQKINEPEDPEMPAKLIELKGRPLNPMDIQAIWDKFSYLNNTDTPTRKKDVKLSGYLPYRSFAQLERQLDKEFSRVKGQTDKYSMYSYYNHRDFKIVIGLKYLALLAKQLGVPRKVAPVLSFPLGTNEVSVADVAKIYQTFVGGKVYRFYKNGPLNQLNFIRRIEDRDGNILFMPERKEHEIMSTCISSQMAQILGKVVTHGTGRDARRNLYVTLQNQQNPARGDIKIRVPSFGKTGTTNDYRTAYFAGYMPVPLHVGDKLDLTNSYTIASYVGYDLNRSMEKGPLKISGARGALPVWIDFNKALIEEKKFGDYIDRHDIKLLTRKVWPVKPDACTQSVAVNLPLGTILGSTKGRMVKGKWVSGEPSPNRFTLRSSLQLAAKGRAAAPKRFFQPFSLAELRSLTASGDVSDTALKDDKSESSSDWEAIFGTEYGNEDFEDLSEDGNDFVEKPLPASSPSKSNE